MARSTRPETAPGPRRAPAWRVAALALAGCAPSEGDGPDRPGGETAADSRPAIRSSDPAAHGLDGSNFPRVQELADGVYSYEQVHAAGGETITTVSLFVVTPAGVLVADGQESPAETARLVRTIGRVTDLPITHVVICSDHGDHTGGNAAFPPGATFLAHPASAANLRAAAARSSPSEAPVVSPTRLVANDTILRLGGREIQVRFLGRAHTGGDLVVYVPDGKVLFMSETYLKGVFPAMRSAFPSEWVDMIARAQAMDVDVYVPGHGIVESPPVLERELETYRRALEMVIAEVTRLHAAGLDPEEALARADFGELERWSLYESQAPRAVARVYAELAGELVR